VCTALLLRLHGVVKFNKAPQEKSDIFDDMETSWRLHGVLTATMALLRSFHGAAMRFYGVFIGDSLRLDCASTAFFALPLCFHSAHMSLLRRSH
jgi:hypothetical protein